jgi:hypothetical protein
MTFFSVSLQKIWKEENLQDGKHNEQLDENHRP